MRTRRDNRPPFIGGGSPVLLYQFAADKSLVARIGPVFNYTMASPLQYWDALGVMRFAGVNDAVFDHHPLTRASLGLLHWPERTNDLLDSDNMASATNWPIELGSPTRSANTAADPTGATTMDTLGDNDTGQFEAIGQTITGIVNNENRVHGIRVRKDAIPATTRFVLWRMEFKTGGTGTTLELKFAPSSNAFNAHVNTGFGTIVDAGVIESADHRFFWLAGKNDASGNTECKSSLWPAVGNNADLETILNTVTGEVTVGGAMNEPGTYPGPYIPTTSAAITRAQPVMRITDLTGIDLSAATAVVELEYSLQSTNAFGIEFNNNTNNRRISIPSIRSEFFIRDDAGDTVTLGAREDYVPGEFHKLAFGWETNNAKYFRDGVEVSDSPDTSVIIPTGLSQIDFGAFNNALQFPFAGHFKSFRLFEGVKPDSTMVWLST